MRGCAKENATGKVPAATQSAPGGPTSRLFAPKTVRLRCPATTANVTPPAPTHSIEPYRPAGAPAPFPQAKPLHKSAAPLPVAKSQQRKAAKATLCVG